MAVITAASPAADWAAFLRRDHLLKIVCVAALLLVCSGASAQVVVPASCVDIARREGYPTNRLSRLQLARAAARLIQLARRYPADPIVTQCLQAVRQALPPDSSLDQMLKELL